MTVPVPCGPCLVPTAAVALWALYLRLQISSDGGAGEIQEIGLPFVGFFQALTNYWIGDSIEDLVIGIAMLLILFLFGYRAVIRRDLISWAFAGFTVVGILLTQQVWRSYFDITRGIAPVITVFVLMVVVIAPRYGVQDDRVSSVEGAASGRRLPADLDRAGGHDPRDPWCCLDPLARLAGTQRSSWGSAKTPSPTRVYAEERIGEVFLRSGQGHDGKFFFVQGNDPWVLEPEVNAVVLDRPLYRSQRMFYPLLAGGFGLFSAEGVVWGLLVVNVIAMGLGTWAVAVLAVEMGLSSWWGLAFLLNIGLVSELNIGGAGIVAAAAAFGAVALFSKNRFWWGVGLLVVAALSREVMLLVAAGSAWWWWRIRGDRARALWTLFVPTAAVALWALYLRLQISSDGGAGEIQEIGLPFVGFFQALTNYWIGGGVEDLVVGVGLMILLFVFVRPGRRIR